MRSGGSSPEDEEGESGPAAFDRHIRIDLPNAEARRAIFEAELEDRPATDPIDLDGLVTRTEEMTPAAIAKIVDTAAPT